jgi:hypothetical protein
MKQIDWADRSWLLSKPEIAADTGVKTLVAGMLTITAILLWVI